MRCIYRKLENVIFYICILYYAEYWDFLMVGMMVIFICIR